MLIYITKPIVHECIMGGFRSVSLWTKPPHYDHYPIMTRISGDKEEKLFVDRGWGIKGSRCSAPAKPFLEQDEVLATKVWEQIVWSCCPKEVSFENHIQWCNQMAPGQNPYQEDNFSNMLYHNPEGIKADIKSNINYKRFVLEVNVRTNEVKIITPTVHWYYGEKVKNNDNLTEKTLEIEEKYANELPYTVTEDRFNLDLLF